MSFLFGGRDKRRIPKNATFSITQEGKEKLQKFTGDAKSRVLVSLETEGTSDVPEIARASGLSKGQVERILLALIQGGYVQHVSAASVSSERPE